MIKMDLSTFVSLHIFISVIVVLICWIFFEIRARIDGVKSEEKHIWRCNICANVYIDSLSDELSKCPNCGSFIKRQL